MRKVNILKWMQEQAQLFEFIGKIPSRNFTTSNICSELFIGVENVLPCLKNLAADGLIRFIFKNDTLEITQKGISIINIDRYVIRSISAY